MKGLAEAFADLNKLLKKLENIVHYLLTSISVIKKTKQTTMDIFLKRVTPPQEQPKAGPSGRIPEEGVGIIGGDSSMQVIVPEDPPVGQDVDVEDSDIDDPDPV